MERTRVAGQPEEYFPGWEDSEWARAHGVTTRHQFLQLVLEKGRSLNGVFGLNLMWNYFPEVVSGLRQLPGCANLEPPALLSRIFPNLHYVWIVRNDKVRQAVSWAIAAQTEVYAAHHLQHWRPRQKPRFDFDQIDHLYSRILEGEAGWRAHFDASGVEPLQILYEELVDDYEGTALRVLDYLGVSPLTPLLWGERWMVRQATGLNDEWVGRYLEIKNGLGKDGAV